MRKCVACAATILVLSAGEASAQSLTGAPAQGRSDLGPIAGIGVQPCSYWTRHRQALDQQADAAVEWLSGYLSGYDQFRVAKNEHLWLGYDIPPLLEFIDRKCATEPGSSPVIVLNRLMYSSEAAVAHRLAPH
jgi:hypothetical protein